MVVVCVSLYSYTGVAAAAAILSGNRKRKRHVFESNPALRKRHCSKLIRRLKETLDELSTRVGLQVHLPGWTTPTCLFFYFYVNSIQL